MNEQSPKKYLRAHLDTVGIALSDVNIDDVFAAAVVLKSAKENGTQVFLCGNGGSAATASHFANDLIKMVGIKAICLSDMTPTVLAYMNDEGDTMMFSAPMARLLQPHTETEPPALVAISCSGNSKNIVNAARQATEFRLPVIALTGNEGGDLPKYADVVVRAPYPDIRVQEDIHLAICHALVVVLRNKWD